MSETEAIILNEIKNIREDYRDLSKTITEVKVLSGQVTQHLKELNGKTDKTIQALEDHKIVHNADIKEVEKRIQDNSNRITDNKISMVKAGMTGGGAGLTAGTLAFLLVKFITTGSIF